MNQEQKKQVAKISVFITSIFVIFMSFAYAFVNQTILGTKRQVITAGRLRLELGEEEEITLENALPMYDKVGILQKPFIFKVHNKSATDIDYTLRLIDVTTSSEKLDPSIIRYGLSTDDFSEVETLSNVQNNEIGSGSIFSGETVTYELRMWIDANIEDESLIKDKSASYKIEVNIVAELDSVGDKVLLSSMKQGDYVAYVGNNGCQNNGTDISGTYANIESKNSCLGWNARQEDTDTEKFGYCGSSSYKYTTTGWRIAYIENNQVYLTSAGSPECLNEIKSEGNKSYIETANRTSRKYCNIGFLGGTCKENSWAMGNEDFYKMTSVMNNGNGRHLTSYYSSSEESHCYEVSSKECGLGNDLIDNGGYYNFAAAFDSTSMNSIYWQESSDSSNVYVTSLSFVQSYGLRPVLRLASSVYVTGGTGTMNDPYTIGNIGFKINEQSRETSHTKTVLSLSASEDTSEMCISNTRSCTEYEPFVSRKEWELLPGDGTKTVYVYYKDNSGKIIARLRQEIKLKMEDPTIEIEESDSIRRKITLSSVGADTMCFSNKSENVEDCSEWIDYKTTYDWILTPYSGEKTVYAFFKDITGKITSARATTNCSKCEPYIVQEDFEDETIDSKLTIESSDAYSIQNGRLEWITGYIAPSGKSSSITIKFIPTNDSKLSFDYGLTVGKGTDWGLRISLLESDKNSTFLVNKSAEDISTDTVINSTTSDIHLKANVAYTINLSAYNFGLASSVTSYIDNINITPAL